MIRVHTQHQGLLVIEIPVWGGFWGSPRNGSLGRFWLYCSRSSRDVHTDHPEHSLIGVKDTRGATLLLQALQDEHWMVRAQAVEMLGALAHPAGVDALETATTDDPDAEVHRAGVTTLAQLAPGRAIPPLLLATQDNDPWVRGEAVAVLGKIGDVGVGIEPHLRPLLADTDEEVREVTRLTIATLEREKD